MSVEATEFAPAKVNLTLRVGRARADGYHPLASLVAFADWGDALGAEPAGALTLTLTGPGGDALAGEPQNLVLKAAYALRAAAGRPELGAALTLEKHLPVAAGLGGGSSDAAAALRLLNRVWDLGFSTRALAEIGSVVGADVPACVHARPLVMTGIGETITPLIAWPALPAVIANPGAALPTGPVFKAFDDLDPAPLAKTAAPVAGTLEAALSVIADGANDLEPPARKLEALAGETIDALAALPGARLARMTGSGASAFALFDTKDAATDAAAALAGDRPGWTVKAVTLGGAA
ncbi:MAG: 4-(cytidine 5'-diphospho)-2-C-methyl-D-erythritol kinase [Oceanicaulis sp.]